MAAPSLLWASSLLLAFVVYGCLRLWIENVALEKHKPTWQPWTIKHFAEDSRVLHHGPSTASRMTINDVTNLSSVDYMACCGAGHRLSKLADAYYLAQKLGYSLRSFWGYCHDNIEVFHHLFGPTPIDELGHVQHMNTFVRINNDIASFGKLVRQGPNHTCACSMDKANETVHLYRSLRRRFIRRDVVETFMQQHDWENRTVVGLHIRAGNGEKGDFQERGRSIPDTEAWLGRVASQIINHQSTWMGRRRPSPSVPGPAMALFVATDTPSMIDRLQTLLQKHDILVWHYQQPRPEEGAGVLFGEQGHVMNTGRQCILGWENTLIDMMLLSHAHILIAARPSSFTQSLPLSLVLPLAGDDENQGDDYQRRWFCEMNPNGTEMRCYRTYTEWCCHGTTEFSLRGIQKYDYLRMPPRQRVVNVTAPSWVWEDRWWERFPIQSRPGHACLLRPEGWKQVCLPYNGSIAPIPRRPPTVGVRITRSRTGRRQSYHRSP